jgi:hypothetical protein
LDFLKNPNLAQISKLLAFEFIKKYQFVAKTNRNFVFHGCEAHILDQLYIIVMYISFNRFKKIQISARNTKVLAFGFTDKRQFVVKTERNSIFLCRESHISHRLYIMVMYISFYGLKNQFWLKI